MRAERFRVFLILLVLCTVMTLSLPTTGLVQDKDIMERIKKIEQDMEKVKKDLDKGEIKLKKIKSYKKQVLAEIDLSEKKIAAVHNNLITINSEQKSIQGRIVSSENRYNQAVEIFESRSDLYAQKLRAMYKRQKISPLSTFFTAASVSSLQRGLKMLKILAMSDFDMLEDMRVQLEEIGSSMKTLQEGLLANMELAKARKREENTLASARNNKRVLLKEIQQDEELQVTRNTQYQEDLRKTQERFNEAIRERERLKKPLPPSLAGYDLARYRGKLSWPVPGRIVSTFGKNVDSRTKTATNNRGIEISAKYGEPVCTIADGQVVMTQFFRGYGNFVMIHHPPDYYTIYGHLSDILVNIDQVVTAGTVIGLAGNTGLVDETSSRVVFEVLKSDKPQNPLTWLLPESRKAGR